MKLLRSVTRRGFTVGQAGMFTITSPNRWFSAKRLPSGFQDLIGLSKRTAARVVASPVASAPDRKTLDHVGIEEPSISLHTLESTTQDHRLVRMVLIALAAAALTFAVLWWMTPANHYGHYGVNWMGR